MENILKRKRLHCESFEEKDGIKKIKSPLQSTENSEKDYEFLRDKEPVLARTLSETRFKLKSCESLSSDHFILNLENSFCHSREFVLHVKGRWCQENVYSPGCFISLYPSDNFLRFSSDEISAEPPNEDKLLVLHPNLLVSGTTLVSSLSCKRKAVLSELFKKSAQVHAKPLLLGNLLHEVFTLCFKSRNFSRQSFVEFYNKVCHKLSYLESFYALKLAPDVLFEEARNYIAPMARLGATLMGKIPNRSLQHLGTGKLTCDEIEKNLWSPSLGLKGKVDMIVCNETVDGQSRENQELLASTTRKQNKIIVELKTGRETNSIEHQDQVKIYMKMSEQKQEIFNCSQAFLIYLKTGNIHSVSQKSVSLRELMMIRNQFVHYLTNAFSESKGTSEFKLPELEEERHKCSHCEQRFNCGLLARLQKGDDKSGEHASIIRPTLTDLHEDSTSVKNDHLQFFAKWYRLCLLEYPVSPDPDYSSIWMKSFDELVSRGLTEGNLKIVNQHESTDFENGNTFVIEFESMFNNAVINLLESDRVLVSSQCLSEINVVSATVLKIDKSIVQILSEQCINLEASTNNVWRLDKVSQTGNNSNTSLMISNLSKLMSSNSDNDEDTLSFNGQRMQRLRELIIESKDASFESTDKHLIPTELRAEAKSILRGLNSQQKLTVRKVLMSHDYTIVRGIPGSGKTTVIVAIIRLLVLCGHTVLLTSFTNTAVDNVLIKLRKMSTHSSQFNDSDSNENRVKVVRLGVKSRVHVDLHPCLAGANGLTYNELTSQFEQANVVAGTVFSVNHPLFTGQRKKFNFCIIDEASQILLPMAIGPLFAAPRFVLVGDENQLGPLVSNQKAKVGGLCESLFEYISSRNDKAVFTLYQQYRMNESIMRLSSTLSYDGKMVAGSPEVATRKLQIGPTFLCNEACCDWIRFCLNPDNAAVFIDTEKCSNGALEKHKNGSYFNLGELEIVRTILDSLYQCGMRMSSVGVICPYRQQLVHAQNMFYSNSHFGGIEVDTIDKFQGRDKEVIILTCVRSDYDRIKEKNTDQVATGGFSDTDGCCIRNELLNDKQRINVAVSRAKSKLFIVGNCKCLNLYKYMKFVIDLLIDQKCFVQYESHLFKGCN